MTTGFNYTDTTLEGLFTYARSGPSIYVPNADGLLIEYPTDVPPVTHKGVLLESSMTNLLLRSNDMSDDRPVWDGSGMTAGDRLLNQIGATGQPNSATWIRDNSNSVAAYVQQEAEFSPAHYGDEDVTYPHTFSVYIRKTTGATVCPAVYLEFPLDEIGGAFAINTNTGAATRISSLGADGSVVVESSGDWWRVALTVGYPNQGATITARVRLYPAASTTSTPGTISVAITGTAVFDFAQLEGNSPIATSAILTYDARTTRGAATLTHENLDDYALPEITALADYSDAVFVPWMLTGTGAILSPLVHISNAGSPNYSVLILGVQATSNGAGNCKAYARNESTTPGNAAQLFDFSAAGKIAASYSQERNETNAAANGVSSTCDADASTYVPKRIVLSATIRAYIRRVEIYMHAKNASDLATLTAE